MKKRNLLLTSICAAFLMLAGTSCTKDETLENVRLSATGEATTRVSIREILEVETDTVGQLAEKIGDRKDIVQKLIIHGPIDAVDVRTIRSLPALLSIDMKEATICGGDSTYTVANWGTHKLYDNIIGEHMFTNLRLSEIVLPDNIVEIDSYGLYNVNGTSDNPFTSIAIPEGVTYIGDHAFCNCTSLNSVQLPEGVERLGEYAFGDCKALQNVTLPESLTTIGKHCFRYTAITSIVIPESVSNIGTEVFQGCGELQSAVLPDNMETIPMSMFSGCAALVSVNLPSNVDIHLKIPHIAIKKGTTLAAFKNKREVSFYQFFS